MDATPLTLLSDQVEILQVFLSWSEDMHVLLGLSFFYCLSTFSLFRLRFSPDQITIRTDLLWAQPLLDFGNYAYLFFMI